MSEGEMSQLRFPGMGPPLPGDIDKKQRDANGRIRRRNRPVVKQEPSSNPEKENVVYFWSDTTVYPSNGGYVTFQDDACAIIIRGRVRRLQGYEIIDHDVLVSNNGDRPLRIGDTFGAYADKAKKRPSRQKKTP